jgi:hypothetical protein
MISFKNLEIRAELLIFVLPESTKQGGTSYEKIQET